MPSSLSIVVKRCVHSNMMFNRGLILYLTPAPTGKFAPKLVPSPVIPTVAPIPRIAYGVIRDSFLYPGPRPYPQKLSSNCAPMSTTLPLKLRTALCCVDPGASGK